MKSLVVLAAVALLSVLTADAAVAQAAKARVIVTVVDPSGAVIPDATVTMVGVDDATKGAVIAPVKTTDKGIATLENLAPGRYAIQAAFPGFELGLLKDVRVRSGGNIRLRDGSLSSRSPLTTTKGAERMQNYQGFFGGSLLKQKSSFSLSVNGSTAFDTPNGFVYIPGVGPRSEPLAIRRPSDSVGVFGLVDYALTRDQTLRVNLQRSSFTSRNNGIGGNDEIERAYSTDNASTFVRIHEAGPLGR